MSTTFELSKKVASKRESKAAIDIITHVAKILLLIVIFSIVAFPQSSSLDSIISKNCYKLTVDNNKFSGIGWDKINSSVQRSRFILLGEQHGIAEIPVFTSAMAQIMNPDIFVAEVDPYIAQTLTQLSGRAELPITYEKKYPEALCFYSKREEFEMVKALHNKGIRLVGIDQVYGSTVAPLYEKLADLSKTKSTKEYLHRKALMYEKESQNFEKAGNDDWLIDRQSEETIDTLVKKTSSESEIVRKMVKDYVTSRKIYKDQSHQARLNLMKKNITDELQNSEHNSKVLIKLGANHCARGISPATFGEFYDVGNMVQNIADINNDRSLHVMVIGKQGTKAIGSNPNFPTKNVQYYNDSSQPQHKLFLDKAFDSDWTVFDLRPARRAITSGKLSIVDQYLQRLIFGYDYVVVIPKTTASHTMYVQE